MTLYLWRISQTANKQYDTFDSAVVCAVNAGVATLIHPNGHVWNGQEWMGVNRNGEQYRTFDSSWTHPGAVSVSLVGVAADDVKSGDVICASFNAG